MLILLKEPPIVSRSKRKWYKAQKVPKYALNSKLQALQILTNDDEVEIWSLSTFLLTVHSYLMFMKILWAWESRSLKSFSLITLQTGLKNYNAWPLYIHSYVRYFLNNDIKKAFVSWSSQGKFSQSPHHYRSSADFKLNRNSVANLVLGWQYGSRGCRVFKGGIQN